MIRSESSVKISEPAAVVFAAVSDPGRAPAWLEGCVLLKVTGGGAMETGAKLQYVYRQGSRPGEMDGEVIACEPDRRLAMRLTDRKFDVEMEITLSGEQGDTRVTHAMTITPKTFGGRLMAPLIRLGNRRQVKMNLVRLKRLTVT
jgi:uncharacterized protein YndB with AHSA1/START domain